jgi:hypothetical protein
MKRLYFSGQLSRGALTYDAMSRVTLLVTAIIGVMVAWAASMPQSLCFSLLFLVGLCWTVSVVLTTIRGLIAASHPPDSWEQRIWTMLGVGGIGMAVLCAIQLECVRLFYARPDLSWNADWRWAWNHAQGIARFGTLDRALDYAGGTVDYHVGPAWLAGAAQRVLGFGLTDVLFGAIPALSTLSTVIAVIHVLRFSGLSRRLAAAAVGFAACVPLGLSPAFLARLQYGPKIIFFDADSWMFATFMLNQHLGLAVGLSSLAVLLDRQSRTLTLIVAGLGLASLIQIKPPFLISLGCVAGVVAIGRLAGWPLFAPRSSRAFIGCVVALVAVAVGLPILPKYPSIFAIPTVASPFQAPSLRYVGIELVVVPLFLTVLAAVLWRAGSWAAVSKRLGLLFEPMAATLLALVGLTALLAVLQFPLRESVLARAAAVGIDGPSLTDFATFALTPMMFPLRLLLVSGIALYTISPKLRSTALLTAIAIVGGLIVLSPVPYVARGFFRPLRGYEAVEDIDLREILRSIPRDGSLVISSDLADAADGTARELRGFLLTAYEGHEFYVADIYYLNYLREDAGERMANLHAFFGSSWTAWHDRWLKETGITHVIIHERCLPIWWQQREQVLSHVMTQGSWSLFVPLRHVLVTKAARPATVSILPRYGFAQCL